LGLPRDCGLRKELNDGTETLLAQSGQGVTFMAR
jgi:hypothetical protein